jgi:hypothetical protein
LKENMKKYLFTILVLLTMLFTSVGVAFAAPVGSGYPALLGVEYVPRSGPVFTFGVNGKLSKANLKGYVHVDGSADFGLHCTQVDEATVRCTTSKKVQDVNVVVHLGEFVFWAYVPPAYVVQYCYNIYDWTLDESNDWMSFGTHCQNTPAEYGDNINWYNPGWEGYYDYEFLPGTPECIYTINEDAYYYPYCPEDDFPF